MTSACAPIKKSGNGVDGANPPADFLRARRYFRYAVPQIRPAPAGTLSSCTPARSSSLCTRSAIPDLPAQSSANVTALIAAPVALTAFETTSDDQSKKGDVLFCASTMTLVSSRIMLRASSDGV